MSFESSAIRTAEVFAVGFGVQWLTGRFFRVVFRFLMINAIELLILYVLGGMYDKLIDRSGLDQVVAIAQPRKVDLRARDPQLVVESGSWASEVMVTFVNDSPRTIQNVSFWCGWTSTRQNQYEDVTKVKEGQGTRWVLRDFPPHSATRVRAEFPDFRVPSDARLETCVPSIDAFDLGRALRMEDR